MYARKMHIVVYDYTGEITGFDVDSNGNRTNGIIETYKNLSKNINAKKLSLALNKNL